MASPAVMIRRRWAHAHPILSHLGWRSTSSAAIGLEPWEGATLPVDSASTPPSSWYQDPAVLRLEAERVFQRSWTVAGRREQVLQPGQFATGELLNLRYLLCRDDAGVLRAFHNVCRHHAAPVAQGAGTADLFRCPYHGWEYDLSGRLRKAPRMKGIKDFSASCYGLVPMQAAAWGPWAFVKAARYDTDGSTNGDLQLEEWLGPGGAAVLAAGAGAPRVHVASRAYDLRCNWKVFVDNYLDGGYHVAQAHPSLAEGLDLGTYTSEILGRVSLQRCAPARQPAGSSSSSSTSSSSARLGQERSTYAFIFPNLMVNIYGPWMDTNTVVPTGPATCRVHFDWYLTPERAGDAEFVGAGLAASDQVQREDVALCEGVQAGLESPGYDTGRYAPALEAPMHQFHRLLHAQLTAEE